MWYEILPCAAIIFTAMTFGISSHAYIPYLAYGRPGMRRLFHPYEHEYYLRDKEIGDGSPYNLKGLENIPDGNEAKQNK